MAFVFTLFTFCPPGPELRAYANVPVSLRHLAEGEVALRNSSTHVWAACMSSGVHKVRIAGGLGKGNGEVEYERILSVKMVLDSGIRWRNPVMMVVLVQNKVISKHSCRADNCKAEHLVLTPGDQNYSERLKWAHIILSAM